MFTHIDVIFYAVYIIFIAVLNIWNDVMILIVKI